MILELGIFIRWPSESGLYRLQRQLLCSRDHLQLEVAVTARASASDVSIFIPTFILGSSWDRIVFLQKGPEAGSSSGSPGLYHH